MTYLYGASVQGIQGFIFRTNELRDIAGASELVEQICTRMFAEMLGNKYKEENQIIAAAGNVKYKFDNREDCEYAVLNFPRIVMTSAPGITISQAVVSYDRGDFKTAIDGLEKKLHTARNKPSLPTTVGLLGVERSRQTGLPVIAQEYIVKEGDRIPADDATFRKNLCSKKKDLQSLCGKSFYGNKSHSVPFSKLCFNIEDMTSQNDWIAVVHADGNGLGKIVQEVGRDEKEYKKFSWGLDKSTALSAKKAYEAVCGNVKEEQRIPIRPVVLGGDDMTVIIRGDLAIAYVESYLKAFEHYTHDIIGQGMTACAGIAFVKSSYPFYYAYDLAEELCSAAKKASKREFSCLMFHKVQDSFITSYEDIIKRELTPNPDTLLQYGPYYIDKHPENTMTVQDLTGLLDQLEGKRGIRTGIRQWLTFLHDNDGRADQHLTRFIQYHKEDAGLIESLTNGTIKEVNHHKYVNTVPAADVLTIYTIKNQDTNRTVQGDKK